MEWEYYTNNSKRRRIDNLLMEAANLFANCEPTTEARREAQEKEKEILERIAKLDRHFAAQCGWNQD
jgi:RecB family exonuclease